MKLFINIRRMVEKYCKTKGRFWNFSQNKQRQSNGKQIFLSIVPDLRRTEMFEMKVRRSFAMAMGEQVTGMF